MKRETRDIKHRYLLFSTKLGLVLIVFFLCFVFYAPRFAFCASGQLILQPAKLEFLMERGETALKNLFLTNNSAQDVKLSISFEDVSGSTEGERPAVLLGKETGPFSLKNFLSSPVEQVILKQGETASLPIQISLPENIPLSGLYGAVIVSVLPVEGSGAEVAVQSRLAALFFVKLKGEAVEDGVLQGFAKIRPGRFYQKAPIAFSFVFKNQGNVYLNPYGVIEIKNIFGKTVQRIAVEPYYALPGALRQREIETANPGLGRYTAKLLLNRGYNDVIDEAEISFWVLPLFSLVISSSFLLGLIVIIIVSILKKKYVAKT